MTCDLWKTGPFDDLTCFNHSKTRLIRYLDLYYIIFNIKSWKTSGRLGLQYAIYTVWDIIYRQSPVKSPDIKT